ncbi:MAG: hypothetical protein V1857_03715 [archaeon]
MQIEKKNLVTMVFILVTVTAFFTVIEERTNSFQRPTTPEDLMEAFLRCGIYGVVTRVLSTGQVSPIELAVIVISVIWIIVIVQPERRTRE